MIEYLRGPVVSRGPEWAVVDVQGVGYRVQTSASALAALPEGEVPVTLWTHLYVREDVRALYGFSTQHERALFVQLLGVSGIGPRMAMAAISMMSPDKLAAAVESGDEASLARIPGVGKRTASRMILDLKGKLSAHVTGPLPAMGGGSAEMLDALMGLGMTRAEAASLLAALPKDEARTEAETLRLAIARWRS